MTFSSQPALAMRELDSLRMAQALELAENAIGLSDPNPRVGCVIGSDDGHVFGTGWTQQVGGPHAEVMALADARAKGVDVRGATAWVTLEPCAHHGRTPPCCDALIGAGIARAVVAIEDPFPQVAGAGIARLRGAGVQVDMASEDQAAAALELNIGFFSRMQRNRPWVRLKVAASIDGRIALSNGTSQWITGELARVDAHAWRKRASAVLTGIGTVLADDPRLDVRLVESQLQPARVIVDSTLRTPVSARVLDEPGRCLIAYARATSKCANALKVRGAELIAASTQSGQVDLHSLALELGRRGMNELHVEAGSQLNGALLRGGLVDEMLIYMAPVMVGIGQGMAQLGPIEQLAAAHRLRFTEVVTIGGDIRLRARTVGLNAPSTQTEGRRHS